MTKRTSTPKNPATPTVTTVDLSGISEAASVTGKATPQSARAASERGFTPVIYVKRSLAGVIFRAVAGVEIGASLTGARFGKGDANARIVIGTDATGTFTWATPGQLAHISDSALQGALDAGIAAKLPGFDFTGIASFTGTSARANALR